MIFLRTSVYAYTLMMAARASPVAGPNSDLLDELLNPTRPDPNINIPEVKTPPPASEEARQSQLRLFKAGLPDDWEIAMGLLIQGADTFITPTAKSDLPQPWSDQETCSSEETQYEIVFMDEFKEIMPDKGGRNVISGMMKRDLKEKYAIDATFYASMGRNETIKKAMYSACYNVWDRGNVPEGSGFNKMCCVRGREKQRAVCTDLDDMGGWCCALCQTTELQLSQQSLFANNKQ